MTEVIVALDMKSRREIDALVDKLGSSAGYYKVGAVPFIYHGMGLIEMLKKKGKKIFLDLKFFDIPNTVTESVRGAVIAGVDMLTVHLLGGMPMLEAAVKARDAEGNAVDIVGVTLLTSMTASDFNFMDIQSFQQDSMVVALTERAFQAGLNGVVCAGSDVQIVKKGYGTALKTVCPGIRLSGSADDQKRVATPYSASKDGADYIVVGRPLYSSTDALKILHEIQKGVADGETRMD